MNKDDEKDPIEMHDDMVENEVNDMLMEEKCEHDWEFDMDRDHKIENTDKDHDSLNCRKAVKCKKCSTLGEDYYHKGCVVVKK
jgi:hypothetical protein